MQSPGRVFSREQLLDGVWGRDVYVDERTVDVHVGRLRKALNRGREPIRSAPCAAPAMPSTRASPRADVSRFYVSELLRRSRRRSPAGW